VLEALLLLPLEVTKAVAGEGAMKYHQKVVARAADLLNAIIDAGDVKAE
jgi:hypothetical protein